MALRLEAMGQAKYVGTAKRTKSDRRAVFTGKINLDRAALEIPLGWKKPRRIFVNSMSDLFHEAVPDHFILEVFAMMERCPQHVFQVLTKRTERMADWTCKHRDWIEYAAGEGEYLRRYGHVWCGTSVEHQEAADARIPWLLRVPARVRFLSCEPLLGPITFRPRAESAADMLRLMETGEASQPTMLRGIHWLICGGESGHGARPMGSDWARSLRDQCQAAGVSYFFKQWGEWLPMVCERDSEHVGHFVGADGRRLYIADLLAHAHEIANDRGIIRLGKKAAGRLLDGVEWSQFPDAGAVGE
jgi:protein gp37